MRAKQDYHVRCHYIQGWIVVEVSLAQLRERSVSRNRNERDGYPSEEQWLITLASRD